MAARWIQSIRIFRKHSIKCVIVYFCKKCLVILSLRAIGGYISGRIQRITMGNFVSRDIWSAFYAEDMKLFLPDRSFQDCLKIQGDLNRLVDWCGANSLKLNIGKCKSITFSRLRHPVEFSYMPEGIFLDRVDSITDLAMMEFVKRMSGEFRDPYTLRILYVSLVRSKFA
jgi:hypothetical protein